MDVSRTWTGQHRSAWTFHSPQLATDTHLHVSQATTLEEPTYKDVEC